MASFKRLVRFKDTQGAVKYGEAQDIPWQEELVGKTVKTYVGGDPWDSSFRLSDEQAKISEVLSPLAQVPVIHGIGLNYKKHAEESNNAIPPYPVTFVKQPGKPSHSDWGQILIVLRSDSLAGPYETIPIHKDVEQLDYEGELTVIIGKDAKNLAPDENPLDYILGYTVGNDVSSRSWQRSGGKGQSPGYAKSFDKFAPMGPTLVSPSLIPDPSKLTLDTYVNGEHRQHSGTNDLIYDIPTLIRHLSRGMTLRRGSAIMTGTPSGVGIFHKPPKWLLDGDVVKIQITEIGAIANKMVYEK